MQFQLSGALLVHKLNIHTGYSPLDISNILAEVLNVEIVSTSDAEFDYTIQFSTNIHRAPKIAIKKELLDEDSAQLENDRNDVPENLEMETSYTDVSDILKMEINLPIEKTEIVTWYNSRI